MSEDFLQFIWKYGLFERNEMITDTGEEVQVINLGEQNADAGPDFLNARLKIGSTIWAGNVEIHVRSADWILHNHHHDKAYDNIILHVVHQYDQPVKRISGEVIPTVLLKYNPLLYERYCSMLNQKGISCHEKISCVDPLIIDIWLNAMVIERLQQKTQHIISLLEQYKNNWEEVFYIVLARTFGFGLNAIPFELTARSLSLSHLLRHRDHPIQVEAMLMGQAGFLNEATLFNGYYENLQKEYIHLKKKYQLKPVEKHLWKFLRLRPVNFPTIRLAQFSSLIRQSEGLFSRIVTCRSLQELSQLLNVNASEFWNTHYTFETPSPAAIKHLGSETLHNITINAVIPFLFIYGKLTGNEDFKDISLTWLNQIPPESNRIIRRWELAGMKPSSAFYSQGLLQLNNMYCIRKRCLACSIGSHLICAKEMQAS